MIKPSIIISLIMLAVIVAGCTSSVNPPVNNPPVNNPSGENTSGVNPTTTISYSAQVSFKTSGGFINPKFSTQQLTITGNPASGNPVTYSVYSSDGTLQRQISVPIDNTAYMQLIDSLNSNNFLGMDDSYGGNNPDTGRAEIIVSQSDVTKNITIGTVGNPPPDALNTIISQLNNIKAMITNPSSPDFTNYGYTVMNTTQISAGQEYNISAGPYMFNIPANTFSSNVVFDILQADPSLVAAYTPDGEHTIFTFALRIRDTTTNNIITSFNPINVTINDNSIDSSAKYYNVAPDGTFTENTNGFETSFETLTHPISKSLVSWAITEPSSMSNENGSGYTNTSTGGTPTINLSLKLANSILVDENGMTLYTFSSDNNGLSSCYGTCADYWPPAYVDTNTAPSSSSDITGTVGVARRNDGNYQATYNGMPLYHYAQDKNPGDMNGNDLYASGGYWYVVNVSSPNNTTNNNTGGNGGY